MRTNRGPARILLLGVLVALPLLLAAQAKKPAQPDALKRADTAFRAGYAARQAGNLEQARARFAEAARLAPQIAEAHEALGAVLVEMGKPAEATPAFEAALKLKPGDPAIELNLALAYAKAGEPGKSLPHFGAVVNASQQPGGAAR